MTSARHAAAVVFPAAAAVLLLGGCSAPPRTTTMTIQDYELIAADIAENLKRDFTEGFLAQRTPESPTMVIAIQKVTNYTSDLMSEGAKWMLMRKLSDSLSRALLRSKNVVFVMLAEHLRDARGRRRRV